MTIRILITVVLIAMRATGVTHGAFQAAAHLFVGVLLGAWLIERRIGLVRLYEVDYPVEELDWNLWLAVALSVAEVACALFFKFA